MDLRPPQAGGVRSYDEMNIDVSLQLSSFDSLSSLSLKRPCQCRCYLLLATDSGYSIGPSGEADMHKGRERFSLVPINRE